MKTEIQKSTGKGTLAIVYKIDSDSYDLLSGDEAINRLSTLQQRLQKLFDEFEVGTPNGINVERLEVSFLSMTHVWRNND